MRLHRLFMITLIAALPSIAAEMDFGEHQLAPPDQFKVVLEFDKDAFTLGELILAHYCVANTGDKAFSVTSGGDYRGTVRALRYKVTVEDDQGNKLADPYSSAGSMCMGGLGGASEVKPGGRWYGSIRLHMYARIEKAGVYKVTVEHDLGWQKKDGVSTAASAKIRVTYPTPDDAKRVIGEALKTPPDHGGSMGNRRAPFLDLTPAVLPEYLPLLADLAGNGNDEALGTIGEMAFPDATRALIEMANAKDQNLSRKALMTLNRRLPDPRWTKQLGSRGPFT